MQNVCTVTQIRLGQGGRGGGIRWGGSANREPGSYMHARMCIHVQINDSTNKYTNKQISIYIYIYIHAWSHGDI